MAGSFVAQNHKMKRVTRVARTLDREREKDCVDSLSWVGLRVWWWWAHWRNGYGNAAPQSQPSLSTMSNVFRQTLPPWLQINHHKSYSCDRISKPKRTMHPRYNGACTVAYAVVKQKHGEESTPVFDVGTEIRNWQWTTTSPNFELKLLSGWGLTMGKSEIKSPKNCSSKYNFEDEAWETSNRK